MMSDVASPLPAAPPAVMPAGWPAAGRPSGSLLRTCCAAAAMLLGLWISWQVAFATWTPDPDVADLPMVWLGVREHGWDFVGSWGYTQDNWLLTMIPLAFAAYAAFGPSPFVTLLLGWLVFVACGIVAAMIARRFVGVGWSLGLGAFFLLCDRDILGRAGFFTYPVEHNSSMLFGLLALWASLRWTSAGRVPALAASGAALFAAALSDPWSKAAFLLPMALAALAWAALPGERTVRRRLLCAGVAFAFVGLLAQTKLFGVFGFLPDDMLLLGDWGQQNANFAAWCDGLTRMFRPLPGFETGEPLTDAGVCLTVLLALIAALHPMCARLARAGSERGFAASAMALSCCGVSAAFLIGLWPDKHIAARFMMNSFYFLPMLVCMGLTHAGRRAPVLSTAVAILAASIMASNAWTSRHDWARPPQELRRLDEEPLAAFLEANDLRYGFGGYWGTQANAVSWVSGERVRIRPVEFDAAGRMSARPWQASPLWYAAGDHPADDGRTFVILGRDPENCPDQAVCARGLEAQFGPPDQVLPVGDSKVLVWPRPLRVPPR